jgi:import inner membrane translocase subunit TIM10
LPVKWHVSRILIELKYSYRMTRACQKKCVPAKYKDSELSKGESVCLDRCVAKYIEIHDRVGRKLASQTMKDQETALKLQGGQLPPTTK